MTKRKKKGIGFGISGLAFVAAGVIMFVTESTPAWFPTILSIVGTVVEMLGFTTVFPDVED